MVRIRTGKRSWVRWRTKTFAVPQQDFAIPHKSGGFAAWHRECLKQKLENQKQSKTKTIKL
jgi:hypothetical protein